MISTDASTPRNPNKPRLSRRLLSHFTLTLSVLLALSFVTLAVVSPSVQKAEAANWRDQVDWLDIWTYSFADEIYDYLLSTRDNAVLTGDPGNFALALAAGFKNTLSMTQNQINDAKNHQDLLSYYYIRKAEWAARQLWLEQDATTKNYVWDPIYVLNRSEIGADLQQWGSFALTQFNNIIRSYDGMGTNLTGFYANCGLGLVWYSSSPDAAKSITISPSSPDLDIEFRMRAISDGYYYYDGVSPLYAGLEKTARTATISDKDGVVFSGSVPGSGSDYNYGRYHEFTADELSLPAGLYKAGGWVGNLIPVLGARSTSIIQHGESAAFIKGGTGQTGIYTDGLTSGHNIQFGSVRLLAYSNLMADWDKTSNSYSISSYVNSAVDLFEKMSDMSTTVLQFAQSYYNAIVVSGDPGGAWDLPLMLMPDPSQMEGMDWQQLYAIYIAYLQQASEWYQDHRGALDASRVNISGESLNLRVRGSIVNQTGVTLYDNTTIWTPFITNTEMVLELGPNDVEFAMYGIKWGNANSMDNFTMSTSSTLIGIDPGYTLYIQEMIYQNESVETLTLTPTTVYITVTGITPPPGPPDIEQITDLDWLMSRWYYIAAIAGIICLLAAISLKNPTIIVAGLVLLAAGAVGYYLAGDFSLLEGFGLRMEPLNLRAWLQNLR